MRREREDEAGDPGPLAGFNAVLGALAAPRRTVDRVFVLKHRRGERFREIREAARRAGVPVQETDARRLARMAGTARHQGVVALPAVHAYAPLEDILEACLPGGWIILLDGVEDPRNLGAVIRTAAAVGARGVVLPEHRSAGLGPGASRSAAGALALVPVARCRNIADLAKDLGERGFWVAGLDRSGETAWDRAVYPRRMALVVGGEARGLRPRVRKACQALISIPLAAGVESLNLSVATAVILYEALRQARGCGTAGPGRARSG